MKKQNGFTLVELAIVLMIIGLLIGGILRGQELMNNARVSATIQQIKAYEGATTSFRDAYGMMAGDLLTATSKIPGCTAANSCANGNADGLVGAADARVWGEANVTNIASENFQFWKHLALAHLISGVDPSASTAVIGKAIPVTKIGGGFSIKQALVSTDAASFNGLVLRTQTGFVDENTELTPVASPQQAGQIDRKMDDGIPSAGDVRSSMNATGAAAAACEVKYNESITVPTCSMFFMVAR